MECYLKFRKLCHFEGRRKFIIVGIVAITYVMVQCFMLPHGNAFKSLGSDHEVLLSVKHGYSSGQLSVRLEKKDENNLSNVVVKRDDQVNTSERFVESGNALNEVDENIRVVWEGTDEDEPVRIEKLEGLEIGYDIQDYQSKVESDDVGKIEDVVGVMRQISLGSNSELNVSSSFIGNANVERRNKENRKQIDYVENRNQVQVQLEDVRKLPGSDHAVLLNDQRVMGSHRRKKVRPGMPPIRVIPIDRMNRILAKHLASSSKMKPQWSSLHDRDKEIIDAKLKIINSDVSQLNNELYAPVFRNVSMFLRSYELMEKILKVYIYRDGKRPIFHQPILKGLYASEGWFMKLMEGNKRFVVKNPDRALLFYMPFSSRMLEYVLYVPNSHNRTKLRQFVKGYTEAIAAKYPFWNRTGGRDHFVVACHDWAPYETRHHMENSIKALCNADATIGFKIGRDVSLPETFVRNERYPLRDLGGKPPSDRNILAFYAGSSHGYLRPILLNHWKDKDPEMRIYGMLPTRVSRRMSYMQHMKSSKYCICPKGHEVNSPRVIEAIFYECVPVIISDNFVPPFFEILNWEAFAIILAEKDIPNLKDILVSIPEEKYIEMQLAVRKVQQHFLWHARPKKYDLFHMTLHSIWYSRVFQIRRQ